MLASLPSLWPHCRSANARVHVDIVARGGAGTWGAPCPPSLVAVEGVKPDYSGPNVTGVVPALLGVRPVEWMPAPVAGGPGPRRAGPPGVRGAGARATVLLVLDGLGWNALDRFADRLPELRAFAGGPVTTVVPSTTPA